MCVCFQSSLTGIHAEPAHHFSITKGYYVALNHFILLMCLPVFKAFPFKEKKLVDRIWRHA